MYAWLRLLGGWSQAVDINSTCALTPLKLGTRGALPSFSCHQHHWRSNQVDAASAEAWVRLEPGPTGPICWGEAGPWQCQHPLAQHTFSPPQLCPSWPAVVRSPSPGTLLSPVSHSACANSLERRGAGGLWGPVAVGLQGEWSPQIPPQTRIARGKGVQQSVSESLQCP